MNSGNDDDFSNTDSWMTDHFLNQLREFNNEFKERLANNEFMMSEVLQNYPNPDILPEYAIGTTTFDTTANTLETFDSAYNRNFANETYDMKTELLDLSFRPVETGPLSFEAVAADGYVPPALDLTTPTTATQLTPLVQIAPETENVMTDVACDKLQEILSPFDSAEEELKLLKFLEEQARNPAMTTNTPSIPQDTNFSVDSSGNNQMLVLPSVSHTQDLIVKCATCSNLFDTITFQSHTCVTNVPVTQEFKVVTEVEPPPTDIPASVSETEADKPEPLLPLDPACIRLLKENQIRIRRFLKDELKYDVNTFVSNSQTKTSLGSDSAETSFASSCDLTNAPVVPQNCSGAKKQDGPHECTLCDRKFVHASGLLRHMEKHALDLIPTTNSTACSGKSVVPQNNAFHNVNGLRVVIKCTLCGRIFFEQHSAFIHLCSHFPKTVEDEQDIDNCVETPYETYVDDALRFLQQETNIASLDNIGQVSQVQEQKAPKYLKMVILSCILQCEFCDFVFSDVSYLFVHSSCHLPERRFECFSCGIHVKSSKEICTHWQAECVFMRENLKIHQAITQRYFVCNVCENKFQSLDLLHEHRYTSYHFFPRLNKRFGILQLPCEYCDYFFDNAHECVSHYEEKHYKRYKRGEREGPGGTSSKTRQYLCDICGKSYTQSSHLWQHLRFHQGVKPFACKEPGCTRKFTIRPDLNDHIRKCHTGERPYHCLICGKRFLTGSVFYQHRLIHRGERRYECEECGKRFYRADALKNHQRIHTGEKPFGCLFCTKNFRQRGDRDKHIRARHSHLDANARIMMQMQKLQLEAAAAFQQQQQQPTMASEAIPYNEITLDTFAHNTSSTVNNENIDPSSTAAFSGESSSGYGSNGGYSNSLNNNSNNNNNDVIMIGNVAFPKTMIESLMLDIDEETVLKAMQLNNMNVS